MMFTTYDDVPNNVSASSKIHSTSSSLSVDYKQSLYQEYNWTHIEPFPDWPVPGARWTWAWQMHVNGLGTIFCISALFTLVTLVLIRKRLLLVHHLLVLGVTLTTYAVFRGMFYLIDPHQTRGVLPVSVSLCLYNLPFSCLTSAFACILLVLMRLTRVQIGPRPVCNHRFIVCSMTVYVLSTLIISTIVSYHPSTKLLLLICQSCFVTSNLLLCFTYVYGGFKMTQFSRDSAKILKQISDMNKLKGGDAVNEGNRKLLALSRVSRPRLNLTALDEGSLSCVTESTASGSDDLEYLNEAFFEGEVNKFTFYNNVPHKRPKRPRNNNTKHAPVDSQETEDEADMSDHETPCSSVSVISGLSQARVFFTKDVQNSLLPTAQSKILNETLADNSTGCDNGGQKEGGIIKADNHSELCDTGYIADTEIPSPCLQRKSKGQNNKKKRTTSQTGIPLS